MNLKRTRFEVSENREESAKHTWNISWKHYAITEQKAIGIFIIYINAYLLRAQGWINMSEEGIRWTEYKTDESAEAKKKTRTSLAACASGIVVVIKIRGLSQ